MQALPWAPGASSPRQEAPAAALEDVLQPPSQLGGTTHVQLSLPEPVPRGVLTLGTDVFKQALFGRGGRVWAGLGVGENCRAAADPSFETSASLSG